MPTLTADTKSLFGVGSLGPAQWQEHVAFIVPSPRLTRQPSNIPSSGFNLFSKRCLNTSGRRKTRSRHKAAARCSGAPLVSALPEKVDVIVQRLHDYHSSLGIPINTDLKDLPRSHRSHWSSAHIFWQKLNGRDHAKRCMGCWMHTDFCICGYYRPVHSRHKFLVYMHPKEFRRSSNTAKLLLATCPSASLSIYGLNSDAASFKAAVTADPARTCVLFPSKDAISVQDFLVRAKESSVTNRTAVEEENALDMESTGLTVVVIDGTWDQAHQVQRQIPVDVPRVAVDGLESSLFDPLRRQTMPGRVSTLEALVRWIQMVDGEDCAEADVLLDQLKVLVDHVRHQTGRSNVYGYSLTRADPQPFSKRLKVQS